MRVRVTVVKCPTLTSGKHSSITMVVVMVVVVVGDSIPSFSTSEFKECVQEPTAPQDYGCRVSEVND
jgi:hypothetical protein